MSRGKPGLPTASWAQLAQDPEVGCRLGTGCPEPRCCRSYHVTTVSADGRLEYDLILSKG